MHAASNGLAERIVQYFVSRKSQITVQQSISNFLLTYHMTIHPTTSQATVKLFLGRELYTRHVDHITRQQENPSLD